MEGYMDIKNTLEIVKAVEVLGVEAKKIAKDGVSLTDLPEALELIKQVDVIVAAVKDAKVAVDEVKELDQAELIQLGSAVYSAFKAIKEA